MTATAKKNFHRKWVAHLKAIAHALGLKDNEFEVRSNKGGSAILGEVVLHSDKLYLMVGGSVLTPETPFVMYRSVLNRHDYTGGPNRSMPLEKLETTDGLDKLQRLMKFGCDCDMHKDV